MEWSPSTTESVHLSNKASSVACIHTHAFCVHTRIFILPFGLYHPHSQETSKKHLQERGLASSRLRPHWQEKVGYTETNMQASRGGIQGTACLTARSQNHVCLWQISWHLRMLDADFEERDHDNDVDYWPLPWLLLLACRLVRSARTLLHEPKPEALRPSSLPYSMCST